MEKRVRILRAVLLASVAAVCVPGTAIAVSVGTVGTIIQGEDLFRTPVGVYGEVDVGNYRESGDTLADLVGQGGNAITIQMSDDLAAVANEFTMTASGCSGAGTQVVTLNTSTALGVCNQIDNNLDQGCNWRGDGLMDIIGPFLCEIDHWEFITGVVPARPTTVDITEVTNAEADIVDYFRMLHDGTVIWAFAAALSGVTNGTELAALIDSRSDLITASYSAQTLTITATSNGPTEFTNLKLEFTTPATTTSVPITGLDDATAAAVNRFTLKLNGSGVDQSTVDFSVVNTVAQLAAELDEIPGIDVSAPGPTEILIEASNAGHKVFTNLSLQVKPVVVASPGSVGYLEGGIVAVDPGLTVSHELATNLASATVSLSPFTNGEDVLSFTPVGGIAGSFSSGVLTLSNTATVADYQTALRSVAYSNNSDDPNTTSSMVSFQVNDGEHNSVSVSRQVVVTPVNDPPVLTLTPTALSYNENDTTPVDAGLDLTDPDSDEIQTAVVSISQGYLPDEDSLVFTDAFGVTGSYSAGTLALTGPATVASFRNALRTVAYHNSSDVPDESLRTVSFTAHDGDLQSDVETRQVAVTPVNDAPEVLTSPGSVLCRLYQVVTVDDGVTVSDVDNATLQWASVAVTGGFVEGEDWLLFSDQNGIAGSYDDTTGILDLSGEATTEQYQTALQTVAYENSSDDPTTHERIVSFEAHDGVDESTAATRIIDFPIFEDGFELGNTSRWITPARSRRGQDLVPRLER